MAHKANNPQVQPKPVSRHVDSLRAKAHTHTVAPSPVQGIYKVTSGGSGNTYYVEITDKGLLCDMECNWQKHHMNEDGTRKPVACSHTIAVFEYIALNSRRKVAAHTSVEQVSRQHRPTVDTQDGVVLVTRKGHYKQADFLKLAPKEE